jgi:tRNA(fMet)-specific endonuclease VapC
MTLFVLDSDILSLLAKGEPIVARCQNAAGNTLATTVISVEEMLSGWYTLLRKSKRKEQVVAAYDQLATSVEFLAAFPLLRFTSGALDRFESFKKMRLGVRGQDLRIAAIVLESGGTLVTRNVRDFQHIPALSMEDWSRP